MKTPIALSPMTCMVMGVLFLSLMSVHAERICDREMAREWLVDHAVSPIEGVWEIPSEQNSAVLIRKSQGQKGTYDIIMLETADTRISPGDKIGTVEERVPEGEFEIAIYSGIKKGLLCDMRKCRGRLSGSDNHELRLYPRKLSVSLRGISLFQQFWRTMRIGYSDPAGEQPVGMRKIIDYTGRNIPETMIWL